MRDSCIWCRNSKRCESRVVPPELNSNDLLAGVIFNVGHLLILECQWSVQQQDVTVLIFVSSTPPAPSEAVSLFTIFRPSLFLHLETISVLAARRRVGRNRPRDPIVRGSHCIVFISWQSKASPCRFQGDKLDGTLVHNNIHQRFER